MVILEVSNVSLSLDGKKILDNLSMEFWQGHIHAVVGPNGAGKTSLAYTVMGLSGYRPSEGDICFDGQSIMGLSVDERARHGLTLGWQEPSRYEGLTVEAFIRASSHTKDSGAVDSALESLGLSPSSYKKRALDKTLSGGERKKIEMASILAMQPSFVMLDEPDSGIDVSSLDYIFKALQDLKEAGTTVALITHSLTVLDQSEHAFLLCCGKLVDKGETKNIRRYFVDKCIPCDHKNEPERTLAEE